MAKTEKDYPICFANSKSGSEVSYMENWTDSEEKNVQVTETLGYVSLDKQVERLIEAGESLIVTRLKEGTYSNEEGDEEFHDSPVDDLSTLSYNELVKLQNDTADNFYIKKAALSHLIKQKQKEEDLSRLQAEKATGASLGNAQVADSAPPSGDKSL